MTTHELIIALQDTDDSAIVVVKLPPIKYQSSQMKVQRVNMEDNHIVVLELKPLGS